MNPEKIIQPIADIINRSERFLLLTHKDPDADGIGSMLALGTAISQTGKKAVCLANGPLEGSLGMLRGSENIVFSEEDGSDYDVFIALDCSAIERIAGRDGRKIYPLVNIDHHVTNDHFGHLNYVDALSSSTGEMVLKIIKAAGLPLGYATAENIFAAIQSDTGSFKYTNTTVSSLLAAVELIEMGVKPWDVAMRVLDGSNASKLELLRMGLGTVSFHHKDRIGVMVLTKEMFQKAGADFRESERFVDYPRCVRGVQIAVLVRQMGDNIYKFSLRSNTTDRVAELASVFGGGGHARAAGFEIKGLLDDNLRLFLKEAERFLNE